MQQKLDRKRVALQEKLLQKKLFNFTFPRSRLAGDMSARPDSEAYRLPGSGYNSKQKTAIGRKKTVLITLLSKIKRWLTDLALRFVWLFLLTPLWVVEILILHLKSGCFVDDYLKATLERVRN